MAFNSLVSSQSSFILFFSKKIRQFEFFKLIFTYPLFLDEYGFEKVVWRLWSGFGIFLGLHFPDFYWLNWFLNPLLLYVRFQSRTRGQSLSSTVVVEVDILTGWSWSYHNVLKLLKRSHLNFSILTFSTNFFVIKSDLSGNTV